MSWGRDFEKKGDGGGKVGNGGELLGGRGHPRLGRGTFVGRESWLRVNVVTRR